MEEQEIRKTLDGEPAFTSLDLFFFFFKATLNQEQGSAVNYDAPPPFCSGIK